MLKLRKKLSGHFKTQNEAKYNAIICLVLNTYIKNGQSVLPEYIAITILQPE
jgi:hypothetical protein